MLVDEADIYVKAGDGGNGAVSFRREKFVPKGGPDGGDGGNGGSVIFVADANKNTLVEYSGRHHWRAPNGNPGSGKKCYGRSGEDLVLSVPPGTIVHDLDLGLTIADLDEVGKRIVIAKGGKGGAGNFHFRTSTNQAPREFGPGEPGQERNLRLELKLIADVGLVGLPNAGKSTLLGAVSAAKPRAADYPFTTLEPSLGIVELDSDRSLTLADIPGLIEGAATGAGLGHDFLKHIERCKVVLHLIDLYPMDQSDPIAAYHTIRGELEEFSPDLAAKHEIVAANKLDLGIEEDDTLDKLRQALPNTQIFPMSGATGDGIRPVLEALWSALHGDDDAE